MQIFSVYPLGYEAIVLMSNKDLRRMAAIPVFFGKFNCSAERLSLAGEPCGLRAMSIFD
jgi:hypothetical protein